MATDIDKLIHKKTPINDRTTFSNWALVYVVTLIFILLAFVLVMIFRDEPIAHIEVLMTIITSLTGTLGVLVGFMWGASSATKKSEAVIEEIKKQNKGGMNIENAEQVTGPIQTKDEKVE